MPTTSFALIPSIALHEGRTSIPPELGGVGQQVVSGSEAARFWLQQGATRLQVIDTDAAAGGAPNTALLREVMHALHGSAHVDLVNGAHDAASLREALHLQPYQVVMSGVAAADPEFLTQAIKEHGDHITMRMVVGDGGIFEAPGSSVDGVDVWGLLRSFDQIGVQRYLLLDATRAGHWWQRHQGIMEEFLAATPGTVTAGSGVDSLERLHELVDLAPQGLDGAVIGHALGEGTFTFPDAIAAVQARYDPYQWGPAQP